MHKGAPPVSRVAVVKKSVNARLRRNLNRKKRPKTRNFAIFRNSSFVERILQSQSRARDRGSAVHKGAPPVTRVAVLKKSLNARVRRNLKLKKRRKTRNFAIFRNLSFVERILRSQLRARDRGRVVHKGAPPVTRVAVFSKSLNAPLRRNLNRKNVRKHAGTCCNTCTEGRPRCVVLWCFRSGATSCCNEL